ncbi:hypothetical protein EMCRGX_G032464 [Ephydatia muelleri]
MTYVVAHMLVPPYSSSIRATPWKDCGSTDIVLNEVEMSGCSVAPCPLPKGANVSIKVTFTPKQAFTQLTNKLYGIVGALGSALPISLPGADEVCKLGASCPVSAGTRNVQIIHIVVQPAYGTPQLLQDYWMIGHPVKIPFGWEGQLHECQQQFCVDLSLLVDHLTFVTTAVCTVQSKGESRGSIERCLDGRNFELQTSYYVVTMYKLSVLLTLVSCAVARVPYSRVRATPWKDCGSTNIVINDVDVKGCSVAPCVLTKGGNVSISVTFTPKEAFTDLTNKLYGIVGGFPVPFPLPQADVCELGVKCPMTSGTRYTQTVDLWIQTSWPDIQVISEWKIEDPSGTAEGCFEIPLKISG